MKTTTSKSTQIISHIVSTTTKDKRMIEALKAYIHSSYHQGKYFPDVQRLGIDHYQEFVSWVHLNGLPDGVCFDHDLGEEKTGYDAAKWLVEYCLDYNLDLPKWNIQSSNPVGKENIECLFKSFEKYEKDNVQ